MRFEWDEDKNRSNQAKHGISFEQAASVFDDPFALSQLDRDAFEEDRYRVLGMAEGIAVLFVVVTYKDDDGDDITRIISARRATPVERRVYQQKTRPVRQP